MQLAMPLEMAGGDQLGWLLCLRLRLLSLHVVGRPKVRLLLLLLLIVVVVVVLMLLMGRWALPVPPWHGACGGVPRYVRGGGCGHSCVG